MTAQFDGYESDTLFNSMQEGGQGVFSLMVDLKSIIDFGEPQNFDVSAPTPAVQVDSREVLVGQELRLELTERSVSPIAGDLKVLWSNGYEGPTYHVRPEDLGTTLTATAIFEGADMHPLEVTIQCGPVVLAPAPVLDRSLVTLTGSEIPAPAETHEADENSSPANGIREFKPVHLYVDSRAFTSAVDAIDVKWIVGGQEVAAERGIEPNPLATAQDVERVLDAHRLTQVEPDAALQGKSKLAEIVELADMAELPNLLADLLADQIRAAQAAKGTTEGPEASANQSDEQARNTGEVEASSTVEVPPLTDTDSTVIPHNAAEDLVVVDNELVDTTGQFFAAQFSPAQGSAGTSLTVEITARAQGSEPMVARLNAGWIGAGSAYELRDSVAVRVAEPRVGETAWVKVKRRDFEPAAHHFSYQWLINNSEIPGATHSAIDVTSEMRGRELSALIEVSGPNAMTSTLEASLGIVGLGDAPEYLGESIEIKGKPRVGNTLKIANLEHDFIMPEADSIEVQWMRGKDLISGERGMGHVVDLQDAGEKIWARITLRKLGHASTVIKTAKLRVK